MRVLLGNSLLKNSPGEGCNISTGADLSARGWQSHFYKGGGAAPTLRGYARSLRSLRGDCFENECVRDRAQGLTSPVPGNFRLSPQPGSGFSDPDRIDPDRAESEHFLSGTPLLCFARRKVVGGISRQSRRLRWRSSSASPPLSASPASCPCAGAKPTRSAITRRPTRLAPSASRKDWSRKVAFVALPRIRRQPVIP